MYDVAIIGAGVVGGMIARTLSAYKLNICILEKNHDVAMAEVRRAEAVRLGRPLRLGVGGEQGDGLD